MTDRPDGGPRLVLATRNAHKVIEMRTILAEALADALAAAPAGGVAGDGAGLMVGGAAALDGAVVGLDAYDAPDVAETGLTYGANALIKARAAAALTGLPAVADDSGLSVDVLGGAPGVFSARWAGRHGDDRANLELLLGQLGDVPDEHRGARFVCAIALVHPAGNGRQRSHPEYVEHGELPGVLERSPRGAGGFGYDPILRPHGSSRTLAELDPAEKNRISHRSQALRAMAPRLLGIVAPATADRA